MFSARKATLAEAEKGRERDHHQEPPREAERDQTTQHRWPRTAWSLAPLVVDEDRPSRDHQFADIETAANLRQAVLLDTDVDHAAFEQHRLGLDPDGGNVALADHRVGRHRRARRSIVDADLEHREHLGLEHTIGIVDLGPDDDTARRQV